MCAAGNEPLLRLLIERGAVINSRDENGWSPLHVAAANGHAGCLRTLINNGVVVHLPSRTGDTALHFAAKNGHAECIHDLILSASLAEVESRNHAGQTAAEVAARYCDVSRGVGQGKITRLEPTTEIIERAKAEKLGALRILNTSYVPGATRGPRPRAREQCLTLNRLGEEERTLQGTVSEQVMEFNAFRFDKVPSIISKLHETIAGQDIAVRSIAEAFQRRETAAFPEDFPLVFAFVGSPGCGKMQLAKATADMAFPHLGSLPSLITINMERYMRKEAAAKFGTALPGLLGVKRDVKFGEAPPRLDAVVVFKDIDRAHPDVFAWLAPVFKEGKVRNPSSNYVQLSVERSAFVMTICAEELTSIISRQMVRSAHARGPRGKPLPPEDRQHFIRDSFLRDVRAPLEKITGPDVAAVIHDVLPFLPYDREELVAIAMTELRRRKKELLQAGIMLKLEGSISDVILANFGSARGIRSIEDTLFEQIVEPIIDAQDQGRIAKGDIITAEVHGEKGNRRIRLKAEYKVKVPKNLGPGHAFYLT